VQDGAVQVVVDGLERGSAQEAIVQFADAGGHLGLAEADCQRGPQEPHQEERRRIDQEPRCVLGAAIV
jgi:hypothetical protein